MNRKFYVVYKITNLIENKCYVGRTKNFETRKETHLWELRKGIHHNPGLQSSWNAHGESAFHFEILELCPVKGRERERYWMKTLRSRDERYGYNIYRIT